MEQDAQDWALLTSEGEGGQFVRELEFHLRSGRDDMLGEAAMNPRRNIRYEADRLTESTIGLTSKNAKRGSARDVVEYLVGVQGDARKTRAANSRRGGWRLNENNMRLSVVAHIRAMHRRAMVTLARAHGITHFMMSIPARRRGRIAPTGACGQQLWRVRTWDEWLAVQTRANAGRIASSAFDSLGLGYGDCTYLVPVPAVYLDQARAYGERMRDKWMATDTKPATRRTALRRAA